MATVSLPERHPGIVTGLRETTTMSQWDAFWNDVSHNLKERIVGTEDSELPALKQKIAHVEELRGYFRELLEKKK